MEPLNSAILINLLGFAIGVLLYAILLVMVLRERGHRASGAELDFLLLAAALIGIIWNAGELIRSILGNSSPIGLTFIANSAISFLPALIVHLAWRNSANKLLKWLTFFAYGASFVSISLHFQSAFISFEKEAWLFLAVSWLVLIGCLVLMAITQRVGSKLIWAFSLMLFALSSWHLGSHEEQISWIIELTAHQFSLFLGMAVLYQNYRFAFGDIFLKRAFSVLLLMLTAFGLYVFIAAPMIGAYSEHDERRVGLLLIFWMLTALTYSYLNKFAAWLVDKVILRRADFEKLREAISIEVEKKERIGEVLDEICSRVSPALSAGEAYWQESRSNSSQIVKYTSSSAEVFIPTTESPYFTLYLRNFTGGRYLLSEEAEMLEKFAVIAARRIDALRVSHERCEWEFREQEFEKLATEAQLSALRSQINPHFLFNALTSIGYLIKTAPDKAFDTLMQLTRLLRGVLTSSGEFSSLEEEIRLIESYLKIEKARFEERLSVKIEVPPDIGRLKIPSFILQPLVENAIKHGISARKRGGEVRVSARLKMIDEKAFLELVVSNSGVILKASGIKYGVGLGNVAERLRNYFGGLASIELINMSNEETAAKIILPVNSVI